MERYILNVNHIANQDNASTFAYNPSSAYFYSNYTVPVIDQVYSYTCGPASYLQALIGNGTLTNSSNNTNSLAIEQAGEVIGTTPQNGSSVEYVTNALNTHNNPASYTWSIFTAFTYNQSINMLQYAFMNDITPIVYVADTSWFNYYNGVSQRHFVTVASINYQSQRIVIVDPNCEDEFRGRHEITFNEFYNAMKHSCKDDVFNSYIIGSTSVD